MPQTKKVPTTEALEVDFDEVKERFTELKDVLSDQEKIDLSNNISTLNDFFVDVQDRIDTEDAEEREEEEEEEDEE